MNVNIMYAEYVKCSKILEGFCMKILLPSVGGLQEGLREYLDCEVGTLFEGVTFKWGELDLKCGVENGV